MATMIEPKNGPQKRLTLRQPTLVDAWSGLARQSAAGKLRPCCNAA